MTFTINLVGPNNIKGGHFLLAHIFLLLVALGIGFLFQRLNWT
jgi:hypothetical protein